MLLLILGCLLILSACDQTKQKSIGNKIAITKDFHVSDSTNEYGQLGNRFYNYLHCCPEKFYHKVSCLFESSSGALTGSSGLL